jgi:hypothetical protein
LHVLEVITQRARAAPANRIDEFRAWSTCAAPVPRAFGWRGMLILLGGVLLSTTGYFDERLMRYWSG